MKILNFKFLKTNIPTKKYRKYEMKFTNFILLFIHFLEPITAYKFVL